MKQVLQSLKTGETSLIDAPVPLCRPGCLLIATQRSLISAGTERMLVEFGQANLVEKALAQPERVRQVIDKMRTDGVAPTLEAVFAKLDEPLPLGYCNAGVVLEVGAGVAGFAVGDRVVSNGPHAEIVCVPQHLCARIPDSVDDDSAAFTVLAAIGLQGIRLAAPTLGETVAVIGLGLIGLITVQLLIANGCRVLGIDFDSQRLELARSFGAEIVDLGQGADPVAAALAYSGGRGIDAVLITASSKSDDPVRQAAQMSRKRGRIVLVGVVGLNLSRADFYEKELTFQVSCSYGPGRHDADYEEKGRDYPLGFVRWTEQRNFEAVLGLLASGRLQLTALVTDHIPQVDAPHAYQRLTQARDSLGILLTYPPASELRARTPVVRSLPSPASAAVRVGLIGVGNFGMRMLLPALKKTGAALVGVASAGGISAAQAAQRFGFSQAVSDYRSLLDDPAINTIFIATRHHLHARLVVEALQAGKHVFVEKPLALQRDELARIEQAVAQAPGQQLMVGFNRRFASLVQRLHKQLSTRTQPLSLIYTVNAGEIPPQHWTQDAAVGGGRIVGEACHFIDLLLFLVGHPIIDVAARMMGRGASSIMRADKMMMMFEFADGSHGCVHYLANGSRAYPKERLEVFSEGRTAVLDNFRSLRGYGWNGLRSVRSGAQDKGHQAEVAAFVERVQNGGPWLIAWEDLRDVTLATFAAVEDASRPAQGPLT